MRRHAPAQDGGRGEKDRFRDVAVASRGIIDEDSRSASVQEATCVERQNMGWL